jgi:hypothetical protein
VRRRVAMGFKNCSTCGKPIDKVYSDGGILAISHGGGQCKECYLKDGHKECPKCEGMAYTSWKFCPNCGYAYP